jgi:propanediol dehydratase large subunit
MTKRKSPTEQADTEQAQEAPAQDAADEIQVDASAFSEVILGNTKAEPLPQTWERVDF